MIEKAFENLDPKAEKRIKELTMFTVIFKK